MQNVNSYYPSMNQTLSPQNFNSIQATAIDRSQLLNHQN